jgi:peptide/nickel transport system substrate-binding protein
LRRTFFVIFAVFAVLSLSCRKANTEFVTIALPEPFSSFDTLTSEKSDAAAERVRNLMFNALVRKTESFDYEGDLADNITTSDDGLTITFKLRNDVKFHNGKEFTSADVKYTFDELFKSKAYKKFSFFDVVDKDFVPHIKAIETPDASTVVFKIARPALKNQLLANLVAVPVIAEGTVGQQVSQPVGTGPFKFTSFDQSQNTVDLEAFADYWDGAPKVQKIRLKTVADASALQAELQTGGVDIAPNPSNLPPDALKTLGGSSNLKVEQFDGSNIQYVGLNTQSAPLNNVKVRQAIGYAIDREKIIKELLSGQAKIADSILPTGSWAYSAGTQYTYDPAKAKQLLQEGGYKGEAIKFKFASGNAAYSSYAQAIQNMLVEVGLNVQIETFDAQTIREDLAKGQFQMNTAVWIGGNQDPIFFRDLFTTAKIPAPNVSCCNRSRYSNPEVDKIVDEAVNSTDRARAKELYLKAWSLISNDLPLVPLWYPANMIVANKRIGNIKISPSGDWSFVKDITVQ